MVKEIVIYLLIFLFLNHDSNSLNQKRAEIKGPNDQKDNSFKLRKSAFGWQNLSGLILF